MASPKNTTNNVEKAQDDLRNAIGNEPKLNPETATQDDGSPAVEFTPPENKFNEPIADAYPEGKYAEITQGTFKPAETIVEYPLSPTDSNPNPHGNRSQTDHIVSERDPDTKVETRKPLEIDDGVEVTGWHPEGVHTGDGRVIAYGDKMTVTKETAKALKEAKKNQGY